MEDKRYMIISILGQMEPFIKDKMSSEEFVKFRKYGDKLVDILEVGGLYDSITNIIFDMAEERLLGDAEDGFSLETIMYEIRNFIGIYETRDEVTAELLIEKILAGRAKKEVTRYRSNIVESTILNHIVSRIAVERDPTIISKLNKNEEVREGAYRYMHTNVKVYVLETIYEHIIYGRTLFDLPKSYYLNFQIDFSSLIPAWLKLSEEEQKN